MERQTDQQKQRNELKERQMRGKTDQQKQRNGLKDRQTKKGLKERQMDVWRNLQTNSKRQTVYTKTDSPTEKEAKRDRQVDEVTNRLPVRD
jgi:hypothetical protein